MLLANHPSAGVLRRACTRGARDTLPAVYAPCEPLGPHNPNMYRNPCCLGAACHCVPACVAWRPCPGGPPGERRRLRGPVLPAPHWICGCGGGRVWVSRPRRRRDRRLPSRAGSGLGRKGPPGRRRPRPCRAAFRRAGPSEAERGRVSGGRGRAEPSGAESRVGGADGAERGRVEPSPWRTGPSPGGRGRERRSGGGSARSWKSRREAVAFLAGARLRRTRGPDGAGRGGAARGGAAA